MARQWGPWENIEQVKECGQAHVFKVKNMANGTIAALKRLKNLSRIERFKNEVEAAKSLDHPHVAKFLDADLSAKEPYAVYEWVDGGSIGDLTKEELAAIPLDDRLNWCQQVSTALGHAHSMGMVHRDIKPDNVLLDRDRKLAKVCDFGLVYFENGERVTVTEEQAGSRFYIAPECEDGRSDLVCPATDLYSLGKLLFYVTSGGQVFSRERQRESAFDLATVLGNPYLEHVSQLIDLLVIHDGPKRLQEASAVSERLAAARNRLAKRLPCKGALATYRCMFCGEGTYRVIACSLNHGNSHNMGYGSEGNIGQQRFVFVECDECGNSQRFKLNKAKDWFAVTHPDHPNEKRIRIANGAAIMPY